MLTFEDLLELREASPAIDHAVEAAARKAARNHPSLHPTVAEVRLMPPLYLLPLVVTTSSSMNMVAGSVSHLQIHGHDHDDLLPPPDLSTRSSKSQNPTTPAQDMEKRAKALVRSMAARHNQLLASASRLEANEKHVHDKVQALANLASQVKLAIQWVHCHTE
jgi:hypothetical protein